ncbi:hypothetical protein [Aestuariivirga litoralis]|uniref:hypothetical protein n=1 Tax=Aestuariivirga litoralis TaxID=2650924 RepID=UPI0018C4A945|nr:hypothetical protein [Aestuariivirga litoralis]MBG1232315.1 hypothetical protein [Aestuariivirga litoralis]
MSFDWASTQFIAVIAVAIILAVYWISSFRRAQQSEAREPQRIFADVMPLLADATVAAGDASGVYKLDGIYRDRFFQFKVIVDSMTARKLPGLWLMVTRPAPQPVVQVIDLMARATAPTAFSNFDLLTHQVPSPSGFPPQVSARSDQPAGLIPWQSLEKQAPLFRDETTKELLVDPKGLRFVVLLAEANRARYGVFRQADFGAPVVSESLAQQLLDALIQLEDDVRAEISNGKAHANI